MTLLDDLKSQYKFDHNEAMPNDKIMASLANVIEKRLIRLETRIALQNRKSSIEQLKKYDLLGVSRIKEDCE